MISLKSVRVEFRRFALQDISLELETGDYFMLVGPTGAGKTLLMETIAGLHPVKSGEIWIEGRDVTRLEPEKRHIGMVYQDCALLPHLSVAENIVFGLKVRRVANGEIKRKLAEIVSIIKVEHLLERKPGKLSGGEKQKVALARALATSLRLLLLDEPLSSLDPESREMLQQELKRLHRELGITVIHITHDFDEALLLGKHIAVIGEGGIRQAGTPEEVFRRPSSEFVARFTRMRNIFAGKISGQTGDGSVFRTDGMELVTTSRKTGATHACIRPDDIDISTSLASHPAPNSFIGTITRIDEVGMAYHIFVNVPPEVCCLVTRRSFREMGLTVGKKVQIHFAPDSVHIF